MGIRALDAGSVTRNLSGIRAIDVGGIVRTIRAVKELDTDGTTLRTVATFAPAMTVSITPTSVSGEAFSGPITTDAATASPAGGLGPYSYAWTVVSYTAATPPTIASSGTATTSFTQSGVFAGQARTAVLRVTATDSLGTTATADVTATFTNTDFS
jgi:hypothetical protein